MYSGRKGTEGDKGDKGDVKDARDISSKVSSRNNLSFIKALFGNTLSLIRVLKELRSFSKPIASKSLPKDKWMPLLD
jgi:hypothetical protein